jgi:hypothetical protein
MDSVIDLSEYEMHKRNKWRRKKQHLERLEKDESGSRLGAENQ